MSTISSERYAQGSHLLHFVVYTSTTGSGEDEVLQHKYHGVEMSHITLHPDGSVNFRVERDGNWMIQFMSNNLAGFTPQPSPRLNGFLLVVKDRL